MIAKDSRGLERAQAQRIELYQGKYRILFQVLSEKKGSGASGELVLDAANPKTAGQLRRLGLENPPNKIPKERDPCQTIFASRDWMVRITNGLVVGIEEAVPVTRKSSEE